MVNRIDMDENYGGRADECPQATKAIMTKSNRSNRQKNDMVYLYLHKYTHNLALKAVFGQLLMHYIVKIKMHQPKPSFEGNESRQRRRMEGRETGSKGWAES